MHNEFDVSLANTFQSLIHSNEVRVCIYFALLAFIPWLDHWNRYNISTSVIFLHFERIGPRSFFNQIEWRLICIHIRNGRNEEENPIETVSNGMHNEMKKQRTNRLFMHNIFTWSRCSFICYLAFSMRWIISSAPVRHLFPDFILDFFTCASRIRKILTYYTRITLWINFRWMRATHIPIIANGIKISQQKAQTEMLWKHSHTNIDQYWRNR